MARNKKRKIVPAVQATPTKATPMKNVSSDSDTDVEPSVKPRCTTITDLNKKVDALSEKILTQQKTISTQQQTIDVLTTRLNFVLSMFGIADGVTQNSGSNFGVSNDKSANSSTMFENVQSGSGSDFTDPTVLSAPSVPSPQSSFQSAVLSAVYTEKKIQENRAKNCVISGLPSGVSCDDKSAVIDLCQNELDISPDIVSCRRLGKQIEGKTQRVLVTLRSIEQAQRIISSAKSLRKSTNVAIRSNVYINADLTKAQAAAEYQVRCQRRRNQAEKRQQENNSTDRSSLRISATPFIPSVSSVG